MQGVPLADGAQSLLIRPSLIYVSQVNAVLAWQHLQLPLLLWTVLNRCFSAQHLVHVGAHVAQQLPAGQPLVCALQVEPVLPWQHPQFCSLNLYSIKQHLAAHRRYCTVCRNLQMRHMAFKLDGQRFIAGHHVDHDIICKLLSLPDHCNMHACNARGVLPAYRALKVREALCPAGLSFRLAGARADPNYNPAGPHQRMQAARQSQRLTGRKTRTIGGVSHL